MSCRTFPSSAADWPQNILKLCLRWAAEDFQALNKGRQSHFQLLNRHAAAQLSSQSTNRESSDQLQSSSCSSAHLQSTFRTLSEDFQSSRRALSKHRQNTFRALSECSQSTVRASSEQLQSTFRALSLSEHSIAKFGRLNGWKTHRQKWPISIIWEHFLAPEHRIPIWLVGGLADWLIDSWKSQYFIRRTTNVDISTLSYITVLAWYITMALIQP